MEMILLLQKFEIHVRNLEVNFWQVCQTGAKLMFQVQCARQILKIPMVFTVSNDSVMCTNVCADIKKWTKFTSLLLSTEVDPSNLSFRDQSNADLHAIAEKAL